MIFVLRFANSGCSLAMYPSSVVQTGVKSFGCENRIAQPSPIQLWKLMVPCVVSAVKSGAVSLMRGMLDVAGVTVAVLIIPPDEISSGRGFVEPSDCTFGMRLAQKLKPTRIAPSGSRELS